jgi:hypothetical protein
MIKIVSENTKATKRLQNKPCQVNALDRAFSSAGSYTKPTGRFGSIPVLRDTM